MKLFNKIFKDIFNPITKEKFKDSSTPANVGCICNQNMKGNPTSGWCSKHHTDWI